MTTVSELETKKVELEAKIAELEAAQAVSEALPALIEGVGEAVYRMALPEGHYEYISPWVDHVLGYSSQDCLNNPVLIQKAIHPDFTEYFQEKWSELLAGHVAPTYEYKLIDPEGNERWVMQSNRGVYNNEGQLMAIEGLVRDITEQKRLEETLHESQERYELALATTNDGFWDWDMQTDEVFFNDRYYTQLGYEPGDFPMTFSAWENLVHPDDLAQAKQDLQDYVTGKVPEFRIEFRARMKQGDWKWIMGTGRIVVRGADGRPLRMMGMHADITLIKEAQKEQARLQEERIEVQRQALQDLSTPVIPVMEHVLVMPLIGSIDTLRARDIMRALLAGITKHRAKVVILDVTGVPVMDTGIVNHLNKTIQAARLKGSRTIVTGISDAVAEAIVDLGIDWGAVETLRDLQTGLGVALNAMGINFNRETE